MQIISTDETVRSETVQKLKYFNFQSLTFQTKKGEQLVTMMPAIKKAFISMCDDIVELTQKTKIQRNNLDPTMENG